MDTKLLTIHTLVCILSSSTEEPAVRPIITSKPDIFRALVGIVSHSDSLGEVRDKVGGLDGFAYVQEHGSPKGKSKVVAFFKLLLDGGSSDQVVQDYKDVDAIVRR
ncbi:hypothetical protein JHK87_031383 [Glycine soja]|nr:hypothetical protein JHK87_031383 [Glycine soja]